MRMQRGLLGGVVLIAAAAGCGVEPNPVVRSDDPVSLDVEFEVDPGAGSVRILGQHLGGVREQALIQLTEDRNGTPGTAAVTNSVEAVVACNGGGACASPNVAPGTVVNGCAPGLNSFEFDITVRGFTPNGLSSAYMNIVSITPLVGTDAPSSFALCNSDAGSPNESLAGAPLAAGLGLIRYGHLAANPVNAGLPGAAQSSDFGRWKFKAPNNNAYRFTARFFGNLCGSACSPGPTVASPDFWYPEEAGTNNREVNAIVEGSGVVYVGGDFDYVGPRTGSAAIAGLPGQPSAGEAISPWPSIEGGNVNAIISDGAGGFYVGGSFSSVGSVPVSRIAHIAAGGVLDTSFNASADNTVNALALRGSTLYVGGAFTVINGSARLRIAALDAATGVEIPGFNASTNNTVNAVLPMPSGKVMLGGTFLIVGGASRARLALIDGATGAVDPAFRVAVNASVLGLALDVGQTRVIVGGAFTLASDPNGQVTRSGLLATDEVTRLIDPTWNPNVTGQVNAVIQTSGTVYAGGTFSKVGGVSRSRLAAMASTGSGTPLAWAPTAPQVVNALAHDPGQDIVLVGGVSRMMIAFAANPTVTPAQTLGMPLIGPKGNAVSNVLSLATDGTAVGVGGTFASAGGVARNGLVALDLATGRATSFQPTVANNFTTALAMDPDGNVVVGRSSDAQNAGRLQRFSPAGAVLGDVSLSGGPPLAVAADTTHVYFGGRFTAYNTGSGGQVSQALLARVTRLAGTLGQDAVWRPVVAGTEVDAVLQTNGSVYAGGTFTVGGGANFVQLSTTSPATVQDVFATDGPVRALARGRDFIFAGGSFTTIDGQAHQNLAAVTLSGSVEPRVSVATNGAVQALAVAGSMVHIAGSFSIVDGNSCDGICAVHQYGGALGSSDFNLPVAGSSIAVIGGRAFLGFRGQNVALDVGNRTAFVSAFAD